MSLVLPVFVASAFSILSSMISGAGMVRGVPGSRPGPELPTSYHGLGKMSSPLQTKIGWFDGEADLSLLRKVTTTINAEPLYLKVCS